MSDTTHILYRINSGDAQAAEELLPLVYDELRKLAAARMAAERGDHTLQPTALVHEAYLRLIGPNNGTHWDGRKHFCAAAAEAMRRILIDRARNKKRLKRGGTQKPIDLDAIEVAFDTPDDEMLALDEALRQLEQRFPDCAQLVELRFFGGFSIAEAAEAMGMPKRTADRKLAFARAWLSRELG
jgi:RNA polymerase sigma factor (TIGR02999 family)